MAMRLSWWESAALALPLLLGVLFLASHIWAAGVVLIALVAVVAASRAHIAERNIAGFHTRVRGRLLLLRGIALLAIYFTVVVLLFVMRAHHWTNTSQGRVAFYASVGLAFYLIRDVWRAGNEATDAIVGGDAETRVAAELAPLQERGWSIIHNVLREGRGNVDHVALGPRAAFAIETKSGKYRATDRGQAVSNAIWVKEKFSQRFVTAVLCVGKDSPVAPMFVRHGNASLWVVGPGQLRGLLEKEGG